MDVGGPVGVGLLGVQDLAKVRDVAGGQAECVQLGQLGVRRYPWQRGLELGEGFAQHAHPGPLSCVGRVPLHGLLQLGELDRVLVVRRPAAIVELLGRDVLVFPPSRHRR